MPRFELSIDENYCRSWSTWEGLREMLQNGKDAELEHGATLTVDHVGMTLRIENEGCVLGTDALLLGRTSKRDDRRYIGFHGEGLKTGILALLRAGAAIKIRNGGEVWVPTIEASEKFNARVLVFTIHTGREDKNRVRVEIEGISKENWKTVQDRFLWLYKRDHDHVKTPQGTLLLSDKFKGRIHVKGIWVMNDAELSYGYDFSSLELDRDRRVVDAYNLKSQIRQVWEEAMTRRPDLVVPFLNDLEKGSKDVTGINEDNVHSLPQEVVDLAAAEFVKRFGADAVPVRTMADSKDVEHFGKRGIVTSEPLGAVLSRVLGTFETVKKNLAEEVAKTYSWGDLEAVEKANLNRAIRLMQAVASLDMLSYIDVVDFRSPTLMGQHKAGRLLLARRILADRSECLATLIHEYAHNAGGDGDKGHIAQLEKLWAAVVESLDK